jgi:Gluconate 2-dehydrogenase subunit 3
MADTPELDMTRRDLLKVGVAATVGASLTIRDAVAAQLPSAAAAPAAFFTSGELALAEELAELIIPTDDHSPGAKAAGVAPYINSQLAEAWEDADRTTWRQGLLQVDQLSQNINGVPFLQASPEQRVAVLTRMAANESSPKLPEEKFFAELKSKVAHAYYTSEIGIKQEMEYKGNTYLTEFVGTDVS